MSAKIDSMTETNTSPVPSKGMIGKILVVDDEAALRNILVQALNSQNYDASGAATGAEALEKLRVEDFDLLLSDLMMPEMDGLTLLQAAMAIDPHLVCIMMTGQGSIQTAVDAMKHGAFDYVLKPFRLETMMPVLTRAINTRHLRLENVQLREAVAIHELSQTIAFTLDPQTVLSKLADSALQQSEAEEVSVLLPTADGKELYVAAVRGNHRERLLGERIPFDKSIAGWVGHELMPVILNGEVRDDRFVALWPRPEIRSSVSVPMQVANKLVGILNLNVVQQPRRFTLGQMKALTILAGTAAAALETASLYTKVQRAEENYRSIFENAIDGIFRATPDATRFVSVNPVMAQMFGYDSPAAMVQAAVEVTEQLGLDPARRDEVLDLLRKQGVLEGLETLVRRKDGSEIWTSANVRIVRDAEEECTYLDGIVQDVTERKRAEQALRDSEAEMRALFSSMTDVIIVFDDQGRHLKIAPTKTRLLYKPAAERIGKTLHEIFPQEKADFFLTQIRAALDKDRTQRVEYSLSINESEYWFDGSISPMAEDSVIWVARDITERKQAEEERAVLAAEIENQRQRLNNIVASVPGVVWEAWGEPDAATQRIDFVSVHVETMLGYSREEWLSTPNFWLSIVHPDDKERAARESAAIFAGGKSSNTQEFRWIGKDGRALWVQANSAVITDDAGRPAGMRGVTIDVTERKLAERALRESEERYRDLVENALDIIYSHDLKGNYTSANQAVEHITGYTQEESLQLNLVDTLAPEYVEIARQMLARKLAGEKTTAYELELIAKDGHRIPVEVSTRLVLRDGVPVGVQGIARDITERRRAEAELVLLAAAVEQTADSIMITDARGNIQYVNPAFEHISGYTEEEVLDQNPRILKSGKTDPSVYKELWETISRGEVWVGQLSNRKKDGTIFEEGVTISPVQDKANQIVNYIAVKQDISSLIRLEEQLRQSQKMEAIGQLAGGVAHDFNNLLTAINGYSTLALRRLDDDHPIQGYLEEIKKAGDRAANLTRQLLAFGRKQILQPLAMNLNDIVTDMYKMLRRLIGEDIELIAKLDPALKKIKADPGQLEQVLVNLVVNAKDAMPRGGNLTIETTNVDLDLKSAAEHVGLVAGRYVMMAVSDNGTGMSEETRVHIFEPFFTTKEKGKGTGLGLSTVYGIVKQSGGNIWVYSEPGLGTTFKVYLPQFEGAIKPPAKNAEEAMGPGGSETILLVEDEDTVRALARKILEQAGYKVLDAKDGTEAIRLCQEYTEPIHLLLTDVVMPGIGGKETADRLITLSPKTRVLFMSGYTDEAIVHHGVLDSSVEFIQKPFNPVALAKRVREVLDSKDGGHLES